MPVKYIVRISRGCGQRKQGGLYLFCGSAYVLPCRRLPFALPEACPCCGAGIKQTRGIQFINPLAVFGEAEPGRACPAGYPFPCPVCYPGKRGGLMWVGKEHYPRPDDFAQEARQYGISKRIAYPPKDLKPGDMIYFAHPQGVQEEQGTGQALLGGQEEVQQFFRPGVFLAARFTEIQKVISEDQAKDPEYVRDLEARGIQPVVERDQEDLGQDLARMIRDPELTRAEIEEEAL